MSTHDDHVDLNFKETTLLALEHAFEEAEQKLEETGELIPFTVAVKDGGFGIDDHAGGSVEEVYASAREAIKAQNPESYVFCYDGYVTTEQGDVDAIVCEVAEKGVAKADVLAILYRYNAPEFAGSLEGAAASSVPENDAEEASFVFEEAYGYAGDAETLF